MPASEHVESHLVMALEEPLDRTSIVSSIELLLLKVEGH